MKGTDRYWMHATDSQFPSSLEPIRAILTSVPDLDEWCIAFEEIIASDVFENTWSISQGSARRISLDFNGKVCLTWSFMEMKGLLDYYLFIWGEHASSAVDQIREAIEFSYDHKLAAYVSEPADAGQTAQIIRALSSIYGPPTLILPWEEFNTDAGHIIAAATSQVEGADFVEKWAALAAAAQNEVISALEEEEAMCDADNPAGNYAMAMAHSGMISPPIPGAEVHITLGDDLLPPDSMHYRFLKFAKDVGDLPNWVVAWDECCGTCFRGTYEDLLAEEGLETGAPSLALFGQNSQFYFPPSGDIRQYQVYQNSSDELALLSSIASVHGLPIRVVESDEYFILEFGSVTDS